MTEQHRPAYIALVAALRAEFLPASLEALWIQMRGHRYNTTSLGVLAQAVHDARDLTYDTSDDLPHSDRQGAVVKGKFRKKPVVIEAAQWWRMGDHPAVVAFDRHRNASGAVTHQCGRDSREHGWVDTLEGGNDGAQLVCPGDWIITGVQGEHYPCKPDIFKATYEQAEAEVAS